MDPCNLGRSDLWHNAGMSFSKNCTLGGLFVSLALVNVVSAAGPRDDSAPVQTITVNPGTSANSIPFGADASVAGPDGWYRYQQLIPGYLVQSMLEARNFEHSVQISGIGFIPVLNETFSVDQVEITLVETPFFTLTNSFDFNLAHTPRAPQIVFSGPVNSQLTAGKPLILDLKKVAHWDLTWNLILQIRTKGLRQGSGSFQFGNNNPAISRVYAPFSNPAVTRVEPGGLTVVFRVMPVVDRADIDEVDE